MPYSTTTPVTTLSGRRWIIVAVAFLTMGVVTILGVVFFFRCDWGRVLEWQPGERLRVSWLRIQRNLAMTVSSRSQQRLRER